MFMVPPQSDKNVDNWIVVHTSVHDAVIISYNAALNNRLVAGLEGIRKELVMA